MVVLVETTGDLLEKHGMCLANILVPLMPEACDGQLIMANISTIISGYDVRGVGRSVSTNDCKIHGLEDGDLTKTRLFSCFLSRCNK